MFFDSYDTPVFRPPSEANSFILRVTRGCAHNKCTYCNMYRGVQFMTCTDEEISEMLLVWLIDSSDCVVEWLEVDDVCAALKSPSAFLL